MRNDSFKLALYGCVVYVCCIDFDTLDVVYNELYDCAWNVCMISVCMLIVSNALLISTATAIVRAGEPFGRTPLLRCYLMCVVPSL